MVAAVSACSIPSSFLQNDDNHQTLRCGRAGVGLRQKRSEEHKMSNIVLRVPARERRSSEVLVTKAKESEADTQREVKCLMECRLEDVSSGKYKKNSRGYLVPLILLLRLVFGDQHLNEMRHKSIVFHIWVAVLKAIAGFCKWIRADSKKLKNLLSTARTNAEKSGFFT